jgi:hypothetical protein
MIRGFQSMQAQNVLLLGIVLATGINGNSICTVQLRRPAALELYVLCVITFFDINQNMEPAQWGNIFWQELTSQG